VVGSLFVDDGIGVVGVGKAVGLPLIGLLVTAVGVLLVGTDVGLGSRVLGSNVLDEGAAVLGVAEGVVLEIVGAAWDGLAEVGSLVVGAREGL
jgi:hypothetical protein